MKNTRKSLNILFIGNSHTYYNDMPQMVQRRAADEGFDCRVTMIAHPSCGQERDCIGKHGSRRHPHMLGGSGASGSKGMV